MSKRNPLDINWADPEARCCLAERVGILEYNRLHAAQMERDAVEVCNGHSIRKVISTRWGRLFLIDGAGVAYGTLEQARAAADALSPGRR